MEQLLCEKWYGRDIEPFSTYVIIGMEKIEKVRVIEELSSNNQESFDKFVFLRKNGLRDWCSKSSVFMTLEEAKATAQHWIDKDIESAKGQLAYLNTKRQSVVNLKEDDL